MITIRIVRDGRLLDEQPFDREAVLACREAGDQRVWVDVVEPSDEELSELQSTFGLHELSVEDSRRWGQRSKVEFYEDYVFLVAHGLELDDEDELVDAEVHLFSGQGYYVLTIRREPLLRFEPALARAGRDPGMAAEGVGFSVYLVLDEIVDGYLDTVERLEDLSDDIEEEVFADDGSEELQERIFRLKRKIVRFRRLVSPLRGVIDQLGDRGDIVTPALHPYYRDVQDHVIRATELVDNIRELLGTAYEARLAQASNRLSIVTKRLSAWAGIILVPTLIAGIYGMNFVHMPELEWTFGYPFALGLMAVSASLLYLAFKKRDWI